MTSNPIARPDFLNVMINTTNNPTGTNIWKTLPITFPIGVALPNGNSISYEFGAMSLDKSGTTTTIQDIEKPQSRTLSGTGNQVVTGTYISSATIFSLATRKTNVYLTGSVVELGTWSTTTGAIAMTSTGNKTTAGVPLLAASIKFNNPYSSVSYKYITKNGSNITWYSGNNLTISPLSKSQTNDTW